MSLLLPDDIIDAACALIGEDPIDRANPESSSMAVSIYELVTAFNFGVYQFSFARTLRQLARVTDAVPLSGWKSVFDLPPERVGPPLYITDDVSGPDRRFTRYSLVEATVHSDAEQLAACIKYLPKPHLWSATFKTVTVTACAAKLAFALASDRQSLETLETMAYGTPSENYRGGQMRAAINEDAQATPPRKPDWRNNPFERAWRSG